MNNDALSQEHAENRRPLRTRSYAWPHALAKRCVGWGITPNQMSLLSVVFAAIGAIAYSSVTLTSGWWHAGALLLAALCIQLRLLANLLDGLMAVEHGQKIPTGAIYNELPDRFADVLLFIAAGYITACPLLGWAAALLALLTAYVRALGGALGIAQDFCGPMAKQQRMFMLMLGSVLEAFLPTYPMMLMALVVIVMGSAATVARRTYRLATRLNDHA